MAKERETDPRKSRRKITIEERELQAMAEGLASSTERISAMRAAAGIPPEGMQDEVEAIGELRGFVYSVANALGVEAGTPKEEVAAKIRELRAHTDARHVYEERVARAVNALITMSANEVIDQIKAEHAELIELRETVDGVSRALEVGTIDRIAVVTRALKVVGDVANLRDMHARERTERLRLEEEAKIREKEIDQLTLKLERFDEMHRTEVKRLLAQLEEARTGVTGALLLVRAIAGGRTSWG
jgi:hypothetical protein